MDIETLGIHEKQIVLLKVMEVIIATGIIFKINFSSWSDTSQINVYVWLIVNNGYDGDGWEMLVAGDHSDVGLRFSDHMIISHAI